MIVNNLKFLMKPRILIFSTAYFPFVGGAEVAVREITDRLRGDFDFDLITAKFQKDLPAVEKVGAVTVYRIGIGNPILDKILLPFRGALLTVKLNKTREYFCFWGIMASFATGAGYIFNIFRGLSAKSRIPMVLTLQEGDSENHLNYRWGGLIALSWKMALRRTDTLTGISNFLIKRAEKNGFAGKSFLVPNGVDLKVFSQDFSEDVKAEMKNKLNKREGDIFIVTVGRLTHKNGTDDVIKSLAKLPKNIKFIIIGKGEEGPKLQKLADSLGVTEQVRFLGFVPYAEIPKYLSVCDVFIRPSRSEGFGNAFIEAMASGLPVIATPVGGIPDFIDDGETGVFCAPDSPQSVYMAIDSVISDNTGKVANMVNKAKIRVIERYNWDYIAPEMKKVFDTID